MALKKKINAIFRLMELFLERKEISIYEKDILEEFQCSTKTLERYLKDIELNYAHIVTIKKSRAKFWKLVRVSDIFEEFVNNSYDLTNLFDLAQNFDPEIFKELEKGTLSKVAKNNQSVFLFKNPIMEELQTDNAKEIFQNIKLAIKNYEYRDIVYTYNEREMYQNEKCLKLIFMDNNWYLVVVDEEGNLRFRRLSFIESLSYASRNSYARKEIESYLSFLEKVQNTMTLYNVDVKIATIKATKNIAKYFEKDMKKFLPSQTFKSKEKDGSVIFTLEYTQDLEILPFIQKWLPDLIVLEPLELKKAYIKKLKESIENYEKTS
jgi:predicted DNA-binding transcriptional regulator YafY